MPLPQLIGLPCVKCQKSIASIVDGAFCDECGNPVHRKCLGGDPPPPEEMCPRCGGDPDSDIALEVYRERGVQAQTAELAQAGAPATFPVSKVCPKCTSDKFTFQRPAGWVAFTWDRVCTGCGTRYSPPTPLWAAFLFLAIGLVGCGLGVLGLMAGDICTMLVGVLGVLALIQGLRSLARPGKV